ncbi:PucR family transcriptional regulator [Bacillus sp. NPDC077027]|uniref:PucR family transcriptional regulator n=1 Tax=Bacillus sp. NPDC077027 TaxID=3390548 RepID=UPI003D01AD29
MEEILEKLHTFFDVDKLIAFISGYLKKPVILESTECQLLAYNSYSIQQFDPVNQQTIFSKECPGAVVDWLKKTGVIERLNTDVNPFYVEGHKDMGFNRRVAVSAKHKQEVVGFIWVQDIEESLSEDELIFLHEASFQVGKVIYKNKKQLEKKEGKIEEFFKKVMDDHFYTEEELKWEAENLSIPLPAVFTVMVVHAADNKSETAEDVKDLIRTYLQLEDKVNHVYSVQADIVVILGSLSDRHSAKATARDVIDHLMMKTHSNQTPLFIGIGREYRDVLKMSTSRFEAIEVVKAAKIVGSGELIPYEYDKLGVFRYLDSIYSHQKKKNDVNQDLLLLREKDRDSQTSFLKTLEVYLMNNCKLKPSAEQLFIHQNTLNYRMKQILDMTSINLNDFSQRCQLFIELMLMKKDS